LISGLPHPVEDRLLVPPPHVEVRIEQSRAQARSLQPSWRKISSASIVE